MTARSRFASLFAARDPGRARFVVAVGVAAGALVSAGAGMIIIKAFHADGGLLAMALFLSVMAGNMVQDRSATGRALTTALMIPPLAIALVVATVLSSNRVAVISVFIALSGAAIWVRRFGPRASAIGSLAFMGYFFALFMKPTPDQLPVFCLVGVCAVGAQLIVRLILLLRRPRAEIAILLKELRAASAAALRTTSHVVHTEHGIPGTHAGHTDALHMALARLDDVSRAITAWQQHFPTDRYIACDEDALAGQVLDARADTEEACLELARGSSSSPRASHHASTDARAHLSAILDEHASSARIASATDWADQIISRGDSDGYGVVEDYLIARSVIAHARLRALDLSHGLVRGGRRGNEAHQHPSAPGTPRHLAIRWVPWSRWEATSRMAVQAMIAAALASVVGEAISASRWYWAVMTAFVIFIGATSRGGVLTRAYRRVAGTALGVVVGIVPVMLAGHNDAILISICVLGVFCMLYFGPLNYGYSAFSLTIMLVALYGLLGVLNVSILELRVVETFSGAAIGVVCAYLIGSTNSRRVLASKANAYLDALDELLQSSSSAFGSSEKAALVLSNLNELEVAKTDADRAVSGMTAAFLINRSQRETTDIHLTFIITRSAARLTQSFVTAESVADTDTQAASRQIIDESISEVRESVAAARSALSHPVAERAPDAEQSTVSLALDRLPAGASRAAADAIMALARIDVALRQVGYEGVRDGLRNKAKQTVSSPPV